MDQLSSSTAAIVSYSIVAVCAVVILYVIRLSWKNRQKFLHPHTAESKHAVIPQMPNALPIVGHSFEFFAPAKIHDLYVRMTAAQMTKGFAPHKTVAQIFGLGTHLIQTANADFVKQICVTDYQKYRKPAAIYDPVAYLTGNGLVTSHGPQWKRHRQMLAPLFSPSRLESLISEKMEKQAAKFAEKYENDCNASAGGFVDVAVNADCKKLALGVTMAAILGGDDKDTELFGTTWDHFIHVAYPFLFLLFLVGTRVGTRLSFLFPGLDAAKARIKKICIELINKKKQQLSNDESESASDLLSLMLQAKDEKGEYLHEEELVEQLQTFSFAGFDTTSSLMSCMLYELAMNQDVQKRLHAEIDAYFAGESEGQSDQKLEPMKLPYLSAVVNETLRMHPPVYEVDKQTLVDTYLGPYFIPAGTMVGIDIYGLHHDPDAWPEPERFLPDRWLNAGTHNSERSRFHFAPFSIGQRDCIGKNLALVEAPLVMLILLRKFSVEPNANTKLTLVVESVTQPADLSLRFRKRMFQFDSASRVSAK